MFLADVNFVSISSVTGAFTSAAQCRHQHIPVNVTAVTLTGTAAGNYTVSPFPSVTGTIGGVAITVTGLTGVPKTYDTTTTVTLGGGTLNGVLAADVGNVSVSTASGTFLDPNAGTNKPVTVTSVTLTGTAAGNYYISPMPTGRNRRDPNPLAVTVSGVTAASQSLRRHHIGFLPAAAQSMAYFLRTRPMCRSASSPGRSTRRSAAARASR